MHILSVLFALGLRAAGPAVPANVFADGMVLQRGRPIVVRGTGTKGERVSVRFGDRSGEARVGNDGRWSVALAPAEADRRGRTLVVSGAGGSTTFSNVLVGDVWIAGGQSNMAMTLGECARQIAPIADALAKADLPTVRFLRVDAPASARPVEDLAARAKWVVCAPETAGGVSAAAFFFARRIATETDVPIGIVDVSRGGTPIEPFIPPGEFPNHPVLSKELELGNRADLAGLKALPGGVFARDENWLPGRLFHSRLVPLMALSPRGAIWYQGESNCGVDEDPREYRHKMKALIDGWREAFSNPDLPFFYVQLPGSGARERWPFLREEQRLAATPPRTGMVVTIDLEGGDIHPPNKLDVGERLARFALADVHGRRIEPSGPMLISVELRDGKARARFGHAGAGLMLAEKRGTAPPVETPGAPLRHFELADASGNWRAAEARIEGRDEVVVESASVPAPVAVRYAYRVSPKRCGLFNREGLPASPFCSKPEFLKIDERLPED